MAAVPVLLLLVAAAGTAREYTDEDRTNFPKLFHLDEYERCFARPGGLYCLGTFDLTPAQLPHPTYELMKAYSDESYRHFNRTRIHRGYCVSQRCPTHDTSLHFDNNASLHFESNSTLRFERCADRYARRSSFRASLQKFHYCRTHTDATTVQPPTTAELLYARVVYAVVLANIIGTLYDVYTGDAPNKNHLLTAFSIPANWQRLTEVHEGGDPRLTALACINGFRVIALGFTTFAHATVLQFTFHILKPEYLEQLTQRLDGIFLSDGSSLIQAFVMTSCFLTGYNLLIFSQKRELGLHMLPLCIIKRVIRITPVHLLLVGYGATWWMNSRDGPLVPTTIGLESQACKTKFWHHLFYVNNIVDNKDYCVAPTWFLPVDMHMYILACTLTLLWRRRCTALKLYIFLFAASCLLIGIVAYVQKYKSMIYMATPEELRVVFRDTPSFTDFYMSSWGALPSCFVGLILAHIQFELVEKKIKLSEYKWFVYMLYTTFSLLFIWPLTGIYVRGKHSRLFYAAYIALDRPFYCILMAICLLGSFHVDNPPRRFFSWRGWHSMARLSLTVMMLHWCINITIGSRSTAYSTSILDTFVDWIATNFLTYVVAIPITILVETPMQRFLGALLFTRLR